MLQANYYGHIPFQKACPPKSFLTTLSFSLQSQDMKLHRSLLNVELENDHDLRITEAIVECGK